MCDNLDTTLLRLLFTSFNYNIICDIGLNPPSIGQFRESTARHWNSCRCNKLIGFVTRSVDKNIQSLIGYDEIINDSFFYYDYISNNIDVIVLNNIIDRMLYQDVFSFMRRIKLFAKSIFLYSCIVSGNSIDDGSGPYDVIRYNWSDKEIIEKLGFKNICYTIDDTLVYGSYMLTLR